MRDSRDAGRWVTVFNGARDGYQVPVALAEAGLLESLVTDWYSPLDRRWFRALTGALPSRVPAWLRRRYAEGLPSRCVRAFPLEAARQMTGRAALDRVDARLGARAGRLARKRGAGILAYSYYAGPAFEAHGGGAPRVLFQVQTHPASLRAILHEEMERVPESREILAREPELAGSPERIRQLCEAPRIADLCIVPSGYAGRTLVENGVAPARVRVVPYGVDLDRFTPSAARTEGPFRTVFVGQLTQRKGLKYLLEAWRRLALPGAELVLVGHGEVDRALLRRYEGLFRLELNVRSRERMRALYGESDLFCMPSVSESFGLVFLEALACGTPVIGTPNTGAPDVVRDGEEGFIVPLRDVDALAERIAWCHAHRAALPEFRRRARQRAEEFSWDRFRRGIRDAVGAVPLDVQPGALA